MNGHEQTREPMTSVALAETLNKMERRFFFERRTGRASRTDYIGGNTWRGWRASPKIEDAVVRALVAAFDVFVARFQDFYKQNGPVTRKVFDAFHAGEVEFLFEFTKKHHRAAQVHPASAGDCHGYAYNSYAKVLNLIYTHWFFRLVPNSRPPKVNYAATDYPDLVFCCHVPLDTQIHTGLRDFISRGLIQKPSVEMPNAGMGSVRSKEHYYALQEYLRSIADSIQSSNFPGRPVSPLAFEAFWEG